MGSFDYDYWRSFRISVSEVWLFCFPYESEKVLIVLNPKNEEVNCEIAETMIIKSVIYSNHGEAKINGNKIVVPAASASFFEV